METPSLNLVGLTEILIGAIFFLFVKVIEL